MDTLSRLTILERPVRDWVMQLWIVQGFERCPYDASWAVPKAAEDKTSKR
jgi:hypothetical protein